MRENSSQRERVKDVSKLEKQLALQHDGVAGAVRSFRNAYA